MINALQAKNKLEFLDGSLVKPIDDLSQIKTV